MHTSDQKGAYGLPMLVRELRFRGLPAGKEPVERFMRENDIQARHKPPNRAWSAR